MLRFVTYIQQNVSREANKIIFYKMVFVLNIWSFKTGALKLV